MTVDPFLSPVSIATVHSDGRPAEYRVAQLLVLGDTGLSVEWPEALAPQPEIVRAVHDDLLRLLEA